MKLKAIKKIVFSLFVAVLFSCNVFEQTENSVYGKWIAIEDKNITVNIDGSTGVLTIDYRASGGKVFKSKFYINAKNEIISSLLPKGAKIEFDRQGWLRFYPVGKKYTRDIELFYVLKFKRDGS
tara:strand:- start:29 stop:400 length:372 start_codon:yes stop_codon:yes gene_type:complete